MNIFHTKVTSGKINLTSNILQCDAHVLSKKHLDTIAKIEGDELIDPKSEIADSVVDYYGKMLMHDTRKNLYYMSALMSMKPTKKEQQKFMEPSLLKERTKGIFSYDLILIPWHINENHWILCHISNCKMSDKIRKKKKHQIHLCIYDSMGEEHDEVVGRILELIETRWDEIREHNGSTDSQQLTFDVIYKFEEDIQRNNFDCALYCCFFMLYISEDKETDFHNTIITSEKMSTGMYLRAHFIMTIVTLDPLYPFRLSEQRKSYISE